MSSELASESAAPVTRPKTTGLHQGEIKPGVAKVDPIIVADGVRRTFGGLTAVDVAHVEIPRNAITALIGPNGAGKTTFFNLIAGTHAPSSGQIIVKGEDVGFDEKLCCIGCQMMGACGVGGDLL